MTSAQGSLTAADAPRTRRFGRAALLVAVPLVLATVWSLLLRPELVSLLAPLFGPWAGHLYGHQECTLASATPEVTIAAVALGALALASLALARGRVPRLLAWALAGAWTILWTGMAVLSVLNTLS
jgi:hypothetical protein